MAYFPRKHDAAVRLWRITTGTLVDQRGRIVHLGLRSLEITPAIIEEHPAMGGQSHHRPPR
jgi:hypothetical protein